LTEVEGYPAHLTRSGAGVGAPLGSARPGTGELIYVIHEDDDTADALAAVIRDLGYIAFAFQTPNELLEQVEAEPPHLVFISDGVLRGAGGMLTHVLRTRSGKAWYPIVLALEGDSLTDRDLHAAGVDDILRMPVEPKRLALRVNSLIRLRHKHDSIGGHARELRSRNTALQDELQARNEELERLTVGLVGALEKANQFNDEDTGNHIRRVCRVSALIADGAGLSRGFCDKIFRYASLHDVGKVAIPDSILKKRGALTRQEFEVMKRHTVIGYELLTASGVDVVAKNIAIGHHEKWDGSGYPKGIRGEHIPIEARIVAIADVYDALTTERCYKSAISRDQAITLLRNGKGLHFDPGLVDVFLGSMEEVGRIQDQFPG
jgi:response regulator RpfG family c-di-GMP phosphodiesterase